MKKAVLSALVVAAAISAVLIACNSNDTVTTPAPAPTVAPVVATATPAPAATPTPEATPAPGNQSGVDIDDAGTVTMPKNLSGTACVYPNPEQNLLLTVPVGPGTTSIKSPTCGKNIDVQIDVQRGATCPASGLTMSWDGFLRGRAHATLYADPCPTPTPTPTPTPSPTPPPKTLCLNPHWIAQDPAVTNGEWGQCGPEVVASTVAPPATCDGVQTRTVRTVTEEMYSCSIESAQDCGEGETFRLDEDNIGRCFRVKSDVTTTEKQACEYPATWIEETAVRENETDYGSCEAGDVTSSTNTPPTVDCPGHKTRTVDIVVYEHKSCEPQVKREKSRTNVEEQAPCTAQCEQAFCHTQAIHLDGRFQCQNVPPGTPGHWPHHFSAWPQHKDFFGPCTEQKCYSITN